MRKPELLVTGLKVRMLVNWFSLFKIPRRKKPADFRSPGFLFNRMLFLFLHFLRHHGQLNPLGPSQAFPELNSPHIVLKNK